jgi:hypothetical protein
MSGGTGNGIERTSIEAAAARSGVRISPPEADAVVRSLARIEGAAAALLQPTTFDTTIEEFQRLLARDAAEDARDAEDARR